MLICFLLPLMMMREVEAITSKSSITLENGGYTNVVVAIDETIEENDQLVQAIQRMFVEGSRYLYQATRNRVYFKDIMIIIPSNWTNKPEYSSPGRFTYDVADVIIAPPNPMWRSSPYTQQVQGCGKPGSYIHFVKEFLTSADTENLYGNLGRVLVHEWGHLRWGLFNEYPDPVGDQNDFTYFYQSMQDEKWKPVACSSDFNIRPIILDDSHTAYRSCSGDEYDGYEEGCLSYPASPGNSTGSIMFGTLIFDNIVNFCDNDISDPHNLHNREAPNKHNRLCDSRSAWEVMREHKDFKDGNSPSSNLGEADILPSFTVAQARGADECRIVVVIDTSGSMDTDNRINKAISAATSFVDLVTEGTWVGIVTFAGSASIKHSLIQVSSSSDRDSLHSSLDLSAYGSTCIGCGLDAAIEVLGTHPSDDLAGGDILLMTDGEDSSFATHSIRQTVMSEGVRVNTLAIGLGAYGELNKVANETGGLSFSYGDNDRSAELITSMTKTADRCSGTQSSQRRAQILALGRSLIMHQKLNGSYNLEPSIGTGTQIVVTYTQGSGTTSGVSVNITRPDGTTITKDSPEYDEDEQRKVINILMPGKEQSGEWSYSVLNIYEGIQSITFSVYSRPEEGVSPISIRSDISASTIDISDNVEPLVAYAEVKQGPRPILNAMVQAKVERPDGDPVILTLLDNGAGADVTANDGIYSRYFTEFDNEGYYGISISAENDGNAVILGRSPVSRLSPFINITEDGQVVSASLGNFSLRLPGEPVFEMSDFERAAPFTRSSSAGSTNVPSLPQNFTRGQDLFPPNRVQDLKVKRTSVLDSSVVLIWTAPGDDLDKGTAMKYDIRISESSTLLSVDFANASEIEIHHIMQGNMSNPKPFGALEEYVIIVPDVPAVSTFSYAFALKAFDDAGQASPVSNVVTATFRRAIPTAPPSRVAPCDGLVCRNGGILDENKCTCSCLDEFQGRMCQHVKAQLRNGVQIDLYLNRGKCPYMGDSLRTTVATQLNIFCNSNFLTCCPESGTNESPSMRSFVTSNEVRIADGYPISVESDADDQQFECSLVTYAYRPASSEFCGIEDGSSTRRKFDVMKRSAEPVYVEQTILFEAIESGREGIEYFLINATALSFSIVQITLPKVEGDETFATTAATPTGSSTAIVVTVSVMLVVFILVVAVGIIVYLKKK